jgi:hypothetical protein
MWVCSRRPARLSRVGRHTPYAESALYLARRSTRRGGWERRAAARASKGSLERPDLPRGDGFPDEREVGGAVGLLSATAAVMAALYLALLGHASGLPTQFRIGLSSRPIRGSCETRISSPRGNQVTS